MCGRFSLSSDKNKILEHFGMSNAPDFKTSYNIAPTQEIPVIRLSDNGRELINTHWGLIPHWAKDTKLKPINARAETLIEKPFFRDAFKKRRCLIPANGFYEWQGPKGRKQPYFIKVKDNEIFAFAGLWDHWPEKSLDSATIITTEANDIMKPIHNRMPVIINPDDYEEWLEEGNFDLLRPCPMPMEAWPVSSQVNSPKNQGPDLVQPL